MKLLNEDDFNEFKAKFEFSEKHLELFEKILPGVIEVLKTKYNLTIDVNKLTVSNIVENFNKSKQMDLNNIILSLDSVIKAIDLSNKKEKFKKSTEDLNEYNKSNARNIEGLVIGGQYGTTREEETEMFNKFLGIGAFAAAIIIVGACLIGTGVGGPVGAVLLGIGLLMVFGPVFAMGGKKRRRSRKSNKKSRKSMKNNRRNKSKKRN